jgi:hypothetical protein
MTPGVIQVHTETSPRLRAALKCPPEGRTFRAAANRGGRLATECGRKPPSAFAATRWPPPAMRLCRIARLILLFARGEKKYGGG